MRIPFFVLSAVWLQIVSAATADQWRGRSIYQLFVDRYALPPGAPNTTCNPGAQTWCGGTWNTVRANLDYIQNAGFTAIWISPVNQNWLGGRTPYGDPYHGYWVQDISQLNDHFGTAADLKALSQEVHRRGMYLMVDIVVNNVVGMSTTPDYSLYMFKDQSQYHPYCPISWGNRTSEQHCWLGDLTVTLPDVNTDDATVQDSYGNWIQALVQEYQIDGLRIDAAKHVTNTFWGPFCQKAGVFCIGEVDDTDIGWAAQFQGPGTLDAILNYPMYFSLVQAFAIPGPANITAVSSTFNAMKQKFTDLTLLGNFLENHDNPRWSNISTDPQSMFNAMVWNFMSDGIPIVYYGQEQFFSGYADPWNREPLWPSGYKKTSAYEFIASLNQIRNYLVNTSTTWLTSPTQILTTSANGISIMKGDVVSVMTTIGSPPQNTSMAVYTPYASDTPIMELFSCTQWVTGSNGTVNVQYFKGGKAVILVPSSLLYQSGLCGNPGPSVLANAQLSNALSLIFQGRSGTYMVWTIVVFFWNFLVGYL